MLEHTTYSFSDLAGAIGHPSAGAYTFTGEGAGSVTITKAQDDSAIDVAADGTVMISKLAGHNGVITVVCQQTSTIHKFLLDLYNYLKTVAPTQEWAQITGLFRNTADGTFHEATGICFQKKADIPYQAQGQNVTWNFLAAYIFSQAK